MNPRSSRWQRDILPLNYSRVFLVMCRGSGSNRRTPRFSGVCSTTELPRRVVNIIIVAIIIVANNCQKSMWAIQDSKSCPKAVFRLASLGETRETGSPHISQTNTNLTRLRRLKFVFCGRYRTRTCGLFGVNEALWPAELTAR